MKRRSFMTAAAVGALVAGTKTGVVTMLADESSAAPVSRLCDQMNGSITGLTSTNFPAVNWGYPEADRNHRQRPDDFHRDHVASLIWSLQNDASVPEGLRRQMLEIGLHDEEFVDNGHWPWQLYVRQGRRIEGRALITEHNFTPDPATGKTPTVAGAIAMGEHSFDLHPCHNRRFLVAGSMKGVLWYPKKKRRASAAGTNSVWRVASEDAEDSNQSAGLIAEHP